MSSPPKRNGNFPEGLKCRFFKAASLMGKALFSVMGERLRRVYTEQYLYGTPGKEKAGLRG